MVAKILPAHPAERTFAASRTKPRHTYPVANLEPADFLPYFDKISDNFVARNQWQFWFPQTLIC
jgi:hypothetical protein